MAPRSVILAIDAGSSSIRCTGYEHRGVGGDGGPSDGGASPSRAPVRALEGVCHAVPMASVVPNAGHIRVDEVLSAVDECVDEVLRKLREESSPHCSCRVVAVGFSTFVMNLVGVDANGDPVGEAATLSYACNREDVLKECRSLIRTLGPDELKSMHQRTGAPIHSGYAAPQLLAFYKNPENRSMIEKIESWQTISGLCIHRWTGKRRLPVPMSYSEASWTGMLNFRTCEWDDGVMELLKACKGVKKNAAGEKVYHDVLDLLPPLADFDAGLPSLAEGIAQYCSDGKVNGHWERWPEFRSSSFNLFLGVGDGAAANVGSKCGGYPSGKRVAVTVGTSAAARIVIPLSVESDNVHERNMFVPPGLFCYRVHRGHVLLGGALTDGGSVVEWARSLLNLNSNDAFREFMMKVEEEYNRKIDCCSRQSSPENVTMIPFLSGERSTGYRGGAKGCVSGITRQTTAVDIGYASLESVILRINCVLNLVKGVNCPQWDREGRGVIVASGNALERNSLWRQMLADCSSMDVVVDSDSREAASRGIAILIAGSLRQREKGCSVDTCGIEEPLAIVQEAKATEKPEVKEHWRRASAAQETLIGAIEPTWKPT
ncbi:hypothetical protein ACHAWF_015468 [Thalassiosira exigua]